METQQNDPPLAVPVGLIIMERKGKPLLELRKHTSKPEEIKAIINAAFLNQPIIIMPTFRDRLRATATLIEKKVLKLVQNKNNSYEYEYLI